MRRLWISEIEFSPGLPLAARQDPRRKYQKEGDSFCYFEEARSKFYSVNPNATVGHAVEYLKELELNNVVGKPVQINCMLLYNKMTHSWNENNLKNRYSHTCTFDVSEIIINTRAQPGSSSMYFSNTLSF
jgi:patatin-like phospholipase/acyl hydrolase